MRLRGFAQRLLAAAAFVALPGLALAAEEHSLLTPDGTLHVVRSGRAIDLGIQDATITPSANLIEWTSRAQDGTVSTAILPDTVSSSEKRGLQLAFDDQTQTLLLLWTDEGSYSQVRVGVFHNATWANSGLLPNQGISRAFNPSMAVTHQAVSYLDAQNNPVFKTSSILSIIWWEEAQYGQARLATLFLDEGDFDPQSLNIYDLPALVDSGGGVSYDGLQNGAYLFPALQPDGLSGAILASFADLHDQLFKVVRIIFPSDYGQPSDPTSVNWKRRHIPILGVAVAGPLARAAPTVDATTPDQRIGTSIGSGYRPTMYWRGGAALKFTRLDGPDWAPVRSIAIDDVMTYDRALALVVGMGQRN